MNTATMPEILFSEEELAKITALGSYELRLHQPAGFGVPGHWRMDGQGRRMVYTEKGAEALAASLDEVGYAAAAVCLRAKLKEIRETPSLAMFAQAAKQTEHWWKKGPMA